MKITWELEGKIAVARGLGNLDKKAKSKIRRVVTRNAKRILAAAIGYVPVGETGQLRRSLRARALRGKGPMAPIMSIIGTDVEYARFVEFGTRSSKRATVRGQKAQPYLYRAARVNGWRFRSEIKRELRGLSISG